MNKYNIKDFLRNQLGDFCCSLKDASFDVSNGEYLCSDQTAEDVYNFDEYVRRNFDASNLPASPDAVLLGHKKLYFIEFKNQTPGSINKVSMKNKFEKGTVILQSLLDEFIPKDVEFVFCIVHKNERLRQARSKAGFDSRHIESMATRFGLERKNTEMGNFYSTIITESIDFYKKEFKELVC